MLSVPPAFVLSQDQTLYKSCISNGFHHFEILFNNACVRYYCIFLSLCLTFPVKEFQGSLLFLALFNFQDAVAGTTDLFIISHIFHFVKSFWKTFSKTFLCDVTFNKRLDYYITVCPICQALLKKFFQKLLQTYFPKSRNISEKFNRLTSDSFIIIAYLSDFVK